MGCGGCPGDFGGAGEREEEGDMSGRGRGTHSVENRQQRR